MQSNVIARLFSSRKAIILLLTLIAASAMVFAGKLSTDSWESLVKWLVGAWIVAQGGEDAMVKSAAIKAGIDANTGTAPESTEE